MNRPIFLALALASAPPAAGAAPTTLALSPADLLARTHSYALLLTNTGTFRQLSGTLRYDPVAHACAIDVTFVVNSLALPNAFVRGRAMARDLLDPQDYPTQHYLATCQGGGLVGMLTMHGQTHPFDMALSYRTSGGALTGLHTEGTLNRYDWGITGMPGLVGKMIRITNDISLNGKSPVAAGP